MYNENDLIWTQLDTTQKTRVVLFCLQQLETTEVDTARIT